MGYSRRNRLGGAVRVVIDKPRIPPFEEGAERAVERTCSGLQQQVCAALHPLHLLMRSGGARPIGTNKYRFRPVEGACADAATSGWQRHVYNTSSQPSRSTWSESLSGTTTLFQQTPASRSLPLCKWRLDRKGPEFATSISLDTGGEFRRRGGANKSGAMTFACNNDSRQSRLRVFSIFLASAAGKHSRIAPRNSSV